MRKKRTVKQPPIPQSAVDRSTAVDFPAAVLKGLIEHRDPGAYFGSTGALHMWRTVAKKRGWITDGDTITESGKRHYAESGLEALPKTPNRRAYLWNWSGSDRAVRSGSYRGR
jgi:hypothetical protein